MSVLLSVKSRCSIETGGSIELVFDHESFLQQLILTADSCLLRDNVTVRGRSYLHIYAALLCAALVKNVAM